MSLLVCAFSFFVYIYLKPRSYELPYQIGDIKITEKYEKKYQLYYFEIETSEYKYNFVKKYKYSSQRKLIDEIKIDDACIIPYIDNRASEELCIEEGIQYINIVNEAKGKIEYKDTKIFNYNNYTYALWNYKGLDILNKNKNSEINLFKNDIYNNNLAVLVDNLLLIPNYENEYSYKELILINMKTLKQDKMKLDYEISSDSYVLGVHNGSVFIVDKKEKTEYEIKPQAKKMRVIATANKNGKIYNNDGFEKISMTKLTNDNLSFTFDTYYNYYIDNNTLYLKYQNSDILTKVNNFKNGHIIKIDDDKIYFLINDTLYFFTPHIGTIKLLQNFEWNFNYNNKIFIYSE